MKKIKNKLETRAIKKYLGETYRIVNWVQLEKNVKLKWEKSVKMKWEKSVKMKCEKKCKNIF